MHPYLIVYYLPLHFQGKYSNTNTIVILLILLLSYVVVLATGKFGLRIGKKVDIEIILMKLDLELD